MSKEAKDKSTTPISKKELPLPNESSLSLVKGIARHVYETGIPKQIDQTIIYSTSLLISGNRNVLLRFSDKSGVYCDFDKVLESDSTVGTLVIDTYPMGEHNGYLVSQKLDGRLKEFFEIKPHGEKDNLLIKAKEQQSTEAYIELHKAHSRLLGDINEVLSTE